VQTGQELASVERNRIRVLAIGRERIKGASIAPQYIRVHAHLLGAACHDYRLADRPSQMVKRLAERGARVRVIELWPEQSHERIAPVKGSASIDRQERQEGKALRLHRPIRRKSGRIGDQI